ncbi:MAG: prepilin peptidase [Oscillospiraceae bacterium]|nr:prepilin peptidase [Oscillospiraceae bacterium]
MSVWASGGITAYCCVMAAVLGAVFGSFLNCAAWRVTHGESVLKGRSHCTSCGHVLGAADLVPVFSWLLLKGKCRYCGTKVPARYPLTEAVFALVTVLCLLRFDLTWLCLRNWIFLCCLFCLTLTDIDSMIIPDGCLLIAAAAWLVFLPLVGATWAEIGKSLLAGLVFGGGLLGLSLVMDRILKRDSLGGGDIKLFAVLGLYLGLVGTLFATVLACVIGLGFAMLRRRRSGASEAFPFGPSIAAAGAVMLLWGEPFVNWYLGLF